MRRRFTVAGGTAVLAAQQITRMPHDAVIRAAPQRKDDHHAFLEQGWQRIVEVGVYRFGPEALQHFRGRRCGKVEAGHEAEPVLYLLFELGLELIAVGHGWRRWN